MINEVNQNRNLFSGAFVALYSLRWLVLAYLIANCAISIADIWYQDQVELWIFFQLLYFLISTIFIFCFICRLLNIVNFDRNMALFGKFVCYFFLLDFVLSSGSSYLVSLQYGSLPIEKQEQFVYSYALIALSVIFLPYYFLGTVVPAQILGIRTRIISAGVRSLRQTRYLLPRFLGVFVPFTVLQILLFVFSSYPDNYPVNYSGVIDGLRLFLLVGSTLVGILAESIGMTLIVNTYLKDLEERGELPETEAEVFA